RIPVGGDVGRQAGAIRDDERRADGGLSQAAETEDDEHDERAEDDGRDRPRPSERLQQLLAEDREDAQHRGQQPPHAVAPSGSAPAWRISSAKTSSNEDRCSAIDTTEPPARSTASMTIG